MGKWIIALLTLVSLLTPKPVFAHSFGKLYNLPVPFWMYLYGGAAALFVSFLVIGYFFNKKSATLHYPTYNLSKLAFFKSVTQKEFLAFLKILSVAFLLFTILTGLVGEDSAYVNFNMTFFWIFFVLAFAYLTALIGNIFAIINPWRIITEWAEKLSGEKFKGTIVYPKGWGYFPALLFYFLFIWIELFGQTTPFKLSFLLIQYTILNFMGVFLIGKDNWFRYCEFFSVFFRLIGKLAPIEYPSGKLQLRPPFIGLLKDRAEHFSLLLFILFMLSSTAFDGFKETVIWYRFYWGNIKDAIDPILGNTSYEAFQTVGLLLSPIFFLFIYLGLITLAKAVAQSKSSVKDLALQFAFTLVPIALVYNIAHYYSLILTEGQVFIRILSDPFGFGWNLFNTATYSPNLSIVDAGITWHVQVALILFGHIASVYLAHLAALRVFTSHKGALLSQFPMLFLMVAYTVIGLWVLAQPVTGGTL